MKFRSNATRLPTTPFHFDAKSDDVFWKWPITRYSRLHRCTYWFFTIFCYFMPISFDCIIYFDLSISFWYFALFYYVVWASIFFALKAASKRRTLVSVSSVTRGP
jgi:hypothetical protein